MSVKKILLTSSLLALPFLAAADDASERDLKFGFQFGLASGGETLAKFEFEDGSTEEIKAGSGLILGMSLQTPLAPNASFPLDGKLSFSYMFDTVDAENGDASFKRFPLDMLLLSRKENISFGGGLTYHLNPSLSIDAPGLDQSFDFDDALGFKIEANYVFPSSSTTSYSLGLEYTEIDYEFRGVSFDGSGFSLMLKSSF